MQWHLFNKQMHLVLKFIQNIFNLYKVINNLFEGLQFKIVLKGLSISMRDYAYSIIKQEEMEIIGSFLQAKLVFIFFHL